MDGIGVFAVGFVCGVIAILILAALIGADDDW